MINPKVLVGCPVYNGVKYCIKEFLESVKNIDYPNYDILLVDNSKEDNFFNELQSEKGIKLIKDDTNEEKNNLRVVSSRNKILNYALDKNYDYVLMMDVDVIPPKNIITELLKDNKEIVSGLYYNYFMVNDKQKYNPVCWREIDDELFEKIKEKLKLPELVKSKTDMRRFITPEEANSGETLKVKIPSAGCMLIKRNVFEKIMYGILNIPGIESSDDIFFCMKAREAGFGLYCNTRIKCEHLIMGKFQKDEKGNLRNPFYT